jgi:hypothetical protein
MGVDPAPDLAVEIVVSHPVNDALKVHASFGVREVWVVRKQELKFLVLGEDGRYHDAPSSSCLPILSPGDLTPWVFGENFPGELELRIQFREWVANVLAPRLNPQPPSDAPTGPKE